MSLAATDAVRTFHVLNLGAEVQWNSLFLTNREQDTLFHFDLASFADAGEKCVALYQYLDHVRSLGQSQIWLQPAGKLGDDLLHGVNSTGQRLAAVPVFTAEDHLLRPGSREHRLPPASKYGMVRRQGTSEYRIQVIEKANGSQVVGLQPRRRMTKDTKVCQHLGITTGQERRAEKGHQGRRLAAWPANS